MKEFRKKLKDGKDVTKPLLFIYTPELYMSRYIVEFKEVLGKYADAFDIFYTNQAEKATQYFYTKEFPDMIPYIVIIDPSKRK